MNCLIMYYTFSGNTEEIAEQIAEHLQKYNMRTTMYEIGIDTDKIDYGKYDFIFLGTFTWDYGEVPDEVYPIAQKLIKDVQGESIAIFGSGDTQFGGEALYCRAVDQLYELTKSRYSPLKIEQSPRGSQEQRITTWIERVLYDVKNVNESKNARAAFSK